MRKSRDRSFFSTKKREKVSRRGCVKCQASSGVCVRGVSRCIMDPCLLFLILSLLVPVSGPSALAFVLQRFASPTSCLPSLRLCPVSQVPYACVRACRKPDKSFCLKIPFPALPSPSCHLRAFSRVPPHAFHVCSPRGHSLPLPRAHRPANSSPPSTL